MGTYGIDLGTTYSCIATLDRNGNPEVIKNQEDGTDTLASAVYFESEGNVIIGANAKDYVETDGARVVQFIKREIGKTVENREFFGKQYSPIEISSLILKRLKQIAESQGGIVDDVVITCPAYFGLEERNATRDAGKLAGMNVLNIINEPTAAALSYCARQFQEERNIMVYDLGGGTFDVTIISMFEHEGKQMVKVIATGGNDLLGGKDWDQRLYDHVVQQVCDENGITVSDLDAETRQIIRSKVEKAKQKLSISEKTKIQVPVNGSMTRVVVTKEEFESMTSDLVSQTMTYVESVLEKAGHSDIETVLLVGGSTLMPMIQDAVNARFPGKTQVYDPHLAVAKGAALHASMIVEEITEGCANPAPNPNPNPGPDPVVPTEDPNKGRGGVVDQSPRSFGPGVLDEKNDYIVDNLIKEGDQIPAVVTKVYYTPVANMETIILRVFESMSREDVITPCLDMNGNEQATNPADQVKFLGDMTMELMPATPAHSPIEVTFQVDTSGVYVKAINMSTGESVDTTIDMKSKVDFGNSAVNLLSIGGE